jgi:hypothetical protein
MTVDESTVVLLGAGASVEAELPDTADLTTRVLEFVRGRSASREAAVTKGDAYAYAVSPRPKVDAVRYVYGRLLAHTDARGSGGVVDLERIVTVLDALSQRDFLGVEAFVNLWDPTLLQIDHGSIGRWRSDRVESFDHNLHNFIMAVVDSRLRLGGGREFVSSSNRIRQAVPRFLTLQPHVSVEYLAPLSAWAAACSEPPTVATLNFDLTVETACGDNGVNVHTGVEDWATTMCLGWPEATQLRLLKLHGSVDWEWPEHDQRNRGPMILLGGMNKVSAEGPYVQLLAEFGVALSRASRLVVIGYSGRDEHVNSVTRRWAAIRDSAGAKVEVDIVDPQVQPQLPRRLLGQLSDNIAVASYSMGAGEYLRTRFGSSAPS